jgi:hypothetical protein
VSFYLDKVVTLPDKDWEQLKEHFFIPKNPEEIDHTPIVLQSRAKTSVPLKNNYLIETPQFQLFEAAIQYESQKKIIAP